MSRPALVLFDDDVARDWRPFTLTRPAGELLFGTRTLRERAEAALGLTCVGHLGSDALADFDEPWAPPVLGRDAEVGDAGAVLLRSRFVAEPTRLPDDPALLVSGGRVVGARVPAGARLPDPEFFRDPDAHGLDLPRHEVTGELLEGVWSLMSRNPDRLGRDLAGIEASPLPQAVARRGEHPVSLGRGVEMAPGTILDTRHGPIRLDDGVVVNPFTHLVGPAWVGPGTSLLGGAFTAVSIGRRCKVRGEMEASVVLGYSNKAHDGFLGHAYVGMWVNLGALTTNSDLKNNYGPVRIWTPAGDVDTGETKVGCFLGDHVKTAIGTMLNTGTVIEAGANVFGGMPPKYLPPFSWGDAETPYEAAPFLATARTVMGRRDVELTDRQRRLLEAAWAASRGGARTAGTGR
jgi:UDP-N-acetylglucosamine diphosphorylase / glucose-1-phosphate thymidylyltransferase / UDP-N-acetylgalactosamine diphosphorylase / glucosamine-1-phosphate N-acetyltransferase / galactosamine-1-phosphate N-acetyltransferase